MKKLFLITLIFSVLYVNAQDKTVIDLKNSASRTIKKDGEVPDSLSWKKGGMVGINVAQGSLSNWAAGGDKFSLAINGNVNLYAFYKKNKHNWDNTLDLFLAYLNTTSQGTRKNDDRIDLLSRYGYSVSKKLQLGGLFNFRSQMLKGYSYDKDNNKTLNSEFLSPGYVLVSPGITYVPAKELSIFVSPATARWTIVTNDSLSNEGLYGVDKGKHIKTEFGGFASINYMKDLSKSVSFRSRLDLFSNYLKEPKNVDIFFTNILNMKIGKLFAINYNLDLIYDDDVRLFGPNKNGARAQLKSMLGVGFSYKF